jgi:Ni/Co efflux regulator RcnB
MNKLLSLIVAAMFTAVSGSALAAAHAGAQDKKGDKMEKKADKMEKKEKKAKAEKKKADKAEKKSDKK